MAWDGPAFHAGLVPGGTILAVDGTTYDADALKAAIMTAKTTGVVDLVVKSEGGVASVRIVYDGGLRYPHLERIPGTPDRVGQIFSPRT